MTRSMAATRKNQAAQIRASSIPTQTGDADLNSVRFNYATFYFFVHWSTQSLTVLYQSCEFCGFSTQWPSSGK